MCAPRSGPPATRIWRSSGRLRDRRRQESTTGERLKPFQKAAGFRMNTQFLAHRLDAFPECDELVIGGVDRCHVWRQGIAVASLLVDQAIQGACEGRGRRLV